MVFHFNSFKRPFLLIVLNVFSIIIIIIFRIVREFVSLSHPTELIQKVPPTFIKGM